MEIIPVLHNIRSCYNVGAILRTAEGLGISKVILSGYTPRIHDSKLLPHLREKIDREIHKTALGAEEMVLVVSSEDIFAEIREFKKRGYKIVGLDNNIKKPVTPLNDSKMEELMNEKILLVLGEEVKGIPVELQDLIDLFVEIPMKGKKESFNVSVAAGISMFVLTSL